MTPGKIPTNDLDRALMALVKSKSALPRFLRGRLNKEKGIGPAALARANIIFKQTPYAIEV